jgi:peptidoglycan/xylan/chitin deacetylase (PgdA/CDA1 family)
MLKIRVDDVLQSTYFSSNQLLAWKVKPPFAWFIEATEKWHNYPLVLAVVAEGIPKYSEWVDYIKAHPKWVVQSHGWEHRNYRHLNYGTMVELLKKSKVALEEVFGREVTEFYPPKLEWDDRTQLAAKEAGMVEVRDRFRPIYWIRDRSITSIFFHFWNETNLKEMEKVWLALQEN